MQLKKLALTSAATLGSFAIALMPSIANASSPIGAIEVGGSHNTLIAPLALNGVVKSASATLPGMDPIDCESGSASGNLNPVSASTSDIELSALTLDCPTIIPGFEATIGVNTTKCPHIDIDFTSKVTHQGAGNTAPYDNPVTGIADFGGTTDQCIEVEVGSSSICSFKLYGQIGAAFNETPKGTAPNQSQELTLSGTLTINGKGGFLCPVSNGDTVTFTVVLNVTTPSGLIDFTPAH